MIRKSLLVLSCFFALAASAQFSIGRSNKSVSGTISRIDFKTLRVDATWNVGGSPDMAQVSTDGSQLWVSNRFGTTVSVISTKTGKVIHQIQVGADPHGLSYFPQPGRFSLGHNGVYR